jgi:hypothetical protein
LERFGVIPFLFNVDALFKRYPLNALPHNQRRLLKKWGDPDFGDKPIELIKCWKAGMDNLLVSPFLKRRIRGRAKKDYRRDEHKNPPSSFNFAPTNLQSEMTLTVNDY